jgi:hypothetical protein
MTGRNPRASQVFAGNNRTRVLLQKAKQVEWHGLTIQIHGMVVDIYQKYLQYYIEQKHRMTLIEGNPINEKVIHLALTT